MTQKNLAPVAYATIPSNEDGQPQALVIAPTAGLVVRNGQTGTFTVKLPCQPTVTTTVKTTVIDGANALTVSGGASLTFTTVNWNTPQTVTLSSLAAQAGWQRVLVAPFGADVPGYESVTVHVLVS